MCHANEIFSEVTTRCNKSRDNVLIKTAGCLSCDPTRDHIELAVSVFKPTSEHESWSNGLCLDQESISLAIASATASAH